MKRQIFHSVNIRNWMDFDSCLYLIQMKQSHLHKTALRFLLVLTVLYSGTSFAQEDTLYFNKDWMISQKEDAKYYRIIEKVDTLLKITDYYIRGGKQSEGLMENIESNLEIVKIRGEIEHKIIGDLTYYRKNGKIYSILNMYPFHKTHGINSKYLELLNSVDTVDVDSSRLRFETHYFNNTIGYCFNIDEEIAHGTWLYVDSETGTVLNRTLYSNGKLEGVSFEYWKNGNLKEEIPYKNGKCHGEYKVYNRKGVLVKGIEYDNDMKIATWLYRKPKKK